MITPKNSNFILLMGFLGEKQAIFNTKLKEAEYEITCVDVLSVIKETTSLFSFIEALEQHVIGQDKIYVFIEGSELDKYILIWMRHIILTTAKIIKQEHTKTELTIFLDTKKVIEDSNVETTLNKFKIQLEEMLGRLKVDFTIASNLMDLYYQVNHIRYTKSINDELLNFIDE